MAESVLDVIIDATKSMLGARAVNNALDSIASKATMMSNHLRNRFDTVQRSVFSLQSALIGLGVAGFAKSMIDVSRNLDLAERGLRTVTTSAGQAAVELQRIRRIADEFQFDDLPMANAFRLLVGNQIPDAERALRTLANVALSTGEDVETVTVAMLAGQERALRRMGVQMIDLGTGTVKLAFGGMVIEAKKTDQALRAGLLQLFEKGFPDATKQMGNSIDFQLKRLGDAWEDFQVAIMQGGLQDFLTATFKQIADGVDEEEMRQKGERIANGIKETIKTLSRDAAVVVDVLTPAFRVTFAFLDKALQGFNRLPAELQTLGIFGMLFFGKKGTAAIAGALALMGALEQRFDALSKDPDERKRAAQAPILLTIMEQLMALLSGPKEAPGGGAPGPQSLFGLSEGAEQDTKSALDKINEFWRDVEATEKRERAKRQAATAQAKAERAGGATGLVTGTLNENDLKVWARIDQLAKNTSELEQLEEDKRTRLFDPDMAAAFAKQLEFINSLEQQSLEINEEQIKSIARLFVRQGEALQQTRIWNEVEQERADRIQATNDLLSQATLELRELQDQSTALDAPLEMQERVTAELRLQRVLMQGKVFLSKEEREELKLKLVQMDEENKRLQTKQLLQQQTIAQIMESRRLMDEARDFEFGLTQPSRQSRINTLMREFRARGLDPTETREGLTRPLGMIEANVDEQMRNERIRDLARVNFELRNEIFNTHNLLSVTGKTRMEREAELRVLELVVDARRRGQDLTEEEIDRFGDLSAELTAVQNQLRTANAINAFVDSFEVGWDTILRSGTQAFSHLEDALTQMVMNGKADFATLAQFIEQELIRLSIRQLMWSGMRFLDIGGLLAGGRPSPVTGFTAGGSEFLVNTPQRMGGVQRFQRGGIARQTTMAMFGEGAMPEAFVPLPDGQTIPVTIKGGTAAPQVFVQVVNQHPQAEISVHESMGDDGGKRLQILVEKSIDRAFESGRLDKMMGKNYGLRRRGSA